MKHAAILEEFQFSFPYLPANGRQPPDFESNIPALRNHLKLMHRQT